MTTTPQKQVRAAHTPGPWIVAPSSNMGNGSAWRDILSTGTEFAPSYVGEALEHDAARIVACVEACTGIPDSMLSKGAGSVAPAVTVIGMGAEIERLKEQVRALSAALERTLSWLTSYPGGGAIGKGGPYEQARAALSLAAAESTERAA